MPKGPRKNALHRSIRFGDFLTHVAQNGHEIGDVYEVEAPHRAWRYFQGPEDLLPMACTNCAKGMEMFLDETGGFQVRGPLGNLPG
jgi:hypothetical protein